MNISVNLRRLIEERGMRQADLARASNLSMTTIQNIIDGRSDKPRIDLLLAIADALGVSLYDIIGYKDTGNVNKEFYKKIILTVEKSLRDKNLTVSESERSRYVNELYQFAKEKAVHSQDKELTIDLLYLELLLK